MAFDKAKLLEFRIENFRVFEDSQLFEFAPVTILTGKNNSGKSSLLKAIRLFSSSIKLNNGLYLDFTDPNLKLGSFDEIKNHDTKDLDKITFSFRTEIKDSDESVAEYEFTSKYDQGGLTEFAVYINDECFMHVHGKQVNKRFEYTESFIKLHESVLDIKKIKKRLNLLSEEDLSKIINEIIVFLEKDNRMHVSNDYWYDNFLSQNNYPLFNVRECIYYALNNIGKIKKTGPEISEIFGDSEYPLTHNPFLEEILSQEIKSILDNSFLKEPISNYINYDNIKFYPISEDLFSNILNIDTIESIRAEQAVAFKDTDNPRLAEIFRNYEKLKNNRNSQVKDAIEPDINFYLFDIGYFNNWFKKFGIMDKDSELHIERIDAYGYRVFIKKNERKMHLTEMGYGFTQILPMILKIMMSEDKIIIIEEPEANLHPELQSKLADFFIRAAEYFHIQFIIETHSEYLIRRLQYLTATNKSSLLPADTVIYYFYQPDKVPSGEKQLKKINIQEDGSLTDDFGSGFFDEADKIALDIFLLNKSQKN